MSTNGFRLGSMALISATALATAGTVAGAATPPTNLSTIRSRAASAITLRVNALTKGVSEVNAQSKLGPGAPALASYLQRDIPGLQQLGQKIASDATVASALADAKTIYTNYRVLVLVLPASREAGYSDVIEHSAVPRLSAAATKLATYITSSNQATIGPLLSDMKAQIGAAGDAVSGVAATVLAFTPTQWNADHSLLAPSRASVATAEKDLKQATSDARQIATDLKGSASTSASTPATPTTAS